MTANCSDSCSRRAISWAMGLPDHMERPKSSRTIPHSQSRNWRHRGRSRPSLARSLATSSALKNCPSAKRISTISPGTTRISRKTSTATPSRVGITEVAALEIHGRFVFTGAQHLVVRCRLDHLLVDMHADLAPLVDEPDAQRFVGHGDAAVLEGKGEPLCTCLFEQAAGLLPGRLNLCPIAS